MLMDDKKIIAYNILECFKAEMKPQLRKLYFTKSLRLSHFID